MRPFTEPPPPATTPADDIARELERITDQLAVAAERGFDHSIRVDFDDEGVQKLVLMVNFLLATIQGTMRKLEEKNHQLQAEQESLKILLHQQEALLNNIPDMAWLKDLNSRYIAVNAPLADACRQTPQALVGKTDRDVWNPELAEKYMADDRDVEARGERHTFEERLVDADGFERWVQTIKTPIRDEHGRVIGTAGIAREITDRKLAENAMRRANDQLEAKIEERTQALTELNNQLEKQLAERQSLEAQLVHVQKMESLGELAAGVAHEINNPVAFITSNLGTMTEYIGTLKRLLECYEVMAAKVSATVEPSPELQALFQEIAEISLAEDLPFIKRDIDNLLMESLDGTDRVKEIVQGLKSFARGDTDEIHEADLNECLETSLKIVWNELKYKCRVEKRLGRLPRIPCHPGQLNQVFMNLLVNAAQAIAEHGDIFLETLLEEGEWIVINIRDNGHGISKEHLSTIFDPFFTTKPVGKGTGLGLSISYGIIRKHNGIIQVESTPGQGSTFTIRLPIKGIYHDKKDHSLR